VQTSFHFDKYPTTDSPTMSNTERTFIMIKPDGVHRGLVGDIIKRFEVKGYKLVAMKFMQVIWETVFGC
jgi:nucleoside diphosphate kinase